MAARVSYDPDERPAAGTDPVLTAHLDAYLGRWPPGRDVEVVGWPDRLAPAWDGSRAVAVVVLSPQGAVVSVPPDAVGAARRLVDIRSASGIGDEAFRSELADAVGAPGRASPWLALRWSTQPAALPDAGTWLDAAIPALPDWLHAFPSPVLAALDADGNYVAGVGIKSHTRWGRELAVGTAEEARGRGLGRRLVAQAARAVLADGAVPLYVHHPDNAASAHVADAAGFPDLGWRLLVVFGP